MGKTRRKGVTKDVERKSKRRLKEVVLIQRQGLKHKGRTLGLQTAGKDKEDRGNQRHQMLFFMKRFL